MIPWDFTFKTQYKYYANSVLIVAIYIPVIFEEHSTIFPILLCLIHGVYLILLVYLVFLVG